MSFEISAYLFGLLFTLLLSLLLIMSLSLYYAFLIVHVTVLLLGCSGMSFVPLHSCFPSV